MSVLMTGNYFFVEKGAPSYKVASNFTNYLELGNDNLPNSHWLRARIEDGEFVIDGRLFLSDGKGPIEIRDNMPMNADFKKVAKHNGYEILDEHDRLVLGLRRNNAICTIEVELFTKQRQLVAKTEGDDLKIHRGPAVIGRSGQALGLVIS